MIKESIPITLKNLVEVWGEFGEPINIEGITYKFLKEEVYKEFFDDIEIETTVYLIDDNKNIYVGTVWEIGQDEEGLQISDFTDYFELLV